MSKICQNKNIFKYHIRTRFDSDKSNYVLRFIRKFVFAFNLLEVTEVKVFFMLSFSLTNSALRQFDSTIRSVFSAMFGIKDCLSAVNSLLRTYLNETTYNNDRCLVA